MSDLYGVPRDQYSPAGDKPTMTPEERSAWEASLAPPIVYAGCDEHPRMKSGTCRACTLLYARLRYHAKKAEQSERKPRSS